MKFKHGVNFDTVAEACRIRNIFEQLGYDLGDWDWDKYVWSSGGSLFIDIHSKEIHASRRKNKNAMSFESFESTYDIKMETYSMNRYDTLPKESTGIDHDIRVVSSGFKVGCKSLTATQAATIANFILANVKENK